MHPARPSASRPAPASAEFMALVHPDDQGLVAGEMARALGDPQRFEVELRVLRPDGREVQMRISGGPVFDETGRAVRLAGTTQDVTEQRNAEHALEEAEQRFRSAFEDAPIGMAMTDADGGFLQVNRALERLLGRSRRELVGKSFDDITHPDEVAARRDDLERLVAGEVDAPEVECRYLHADGHSIPVSVTVSVVRDRAGAPPVALAQIQDLTERRRAEAALRLQSEITANMAEGVCLVRTADTQIVYTNRSFEQMFGYGPGELLGQPVAVVDAPTDAHPAETAAEIQTHLAGRGRWVGEVRNVKKDGTEFWCLANVANFDHPDHGEVSIAVHADITERKDWERELGRARDDALEATRLKSEFLANMSHEIRTPMNGISGMTDLLLDSGLDAEQREYADLVRTSGESLLGILNDILDFSKIEAGKLDLDPSDFRLGDAVEDVVDLLAERARTKGVELSVLVESSAPGTVTGDEGRVRQVLLNLVSNAVKFTEEGEIRVSARVAETGSGLVCFEVTDTGIGMEPGNTERLFDSFAQGDSSTSRQYGGTGLGLAIAKQLVQMMGGEIGVRSEVGRGSCFWFTLPLPIAPEIAGDPGGRTERLRRRRLLIVDDSATNRRIVAHHAAAWGMVVDEAEGGPAALELMRAAAATGNPIEILALDMNMPELDGVEVARAVRSDPVLRRTQILLVSSSAGRPADLRENGLDAYLPKPVRRTRLRRAFLMLAGDAVEAEARARRRQLGGGLTVLVAEDNPVNQRLAARMLEKRGLRPEIVENGRRAVEAFERGGHAAVLMDCQMPGMDGYEATREIRGREPAGSHIPVIAMTAHSMRGDRERCLEAGMDDYLSKPLDVEAFDAALARWLPRAVVADGLAETDRGESGNGPRAENGGPRPPEEREARTAVPPANGAGTPRASASTAPATDPAVVARVRSEIGEELFASLAEMLVNEASSGLTEMRAAFGAGDARALGERAHRLKGGASSLGASAMAETARELQDAGRAGRTDGASDLLDRLELELERTRAELGA